MSPQQPVTAEDLYLYAMHLLEADEQTRLQEFLLHSPEARAELENVRGDLALLSITAEQHTPPALTRQRLLQQVAREKKSAGAETRPERQTAQHNTATASTFAAGSTSESSVPAAIQQEDTGMPSTEARLPFRSFQEEPPRRNLFAMVLPWAGWVVAAGLTVSTYGLWQRNQVMQDRVASANTRLARTAEESARAHAVLDVLRNNAAQRFQLTKQSSQPIPNARVTYVADSGSLVFQGANLDQLPPYKVYELWLIPVGEGRTPIPAGTFRPDERGYASLILPDLPKGVVASTFGVTEEDDGGAKTPTLPILMIGS